MTNPNDLKRARQWLKRIKTPNAKFTIDIYDEFTYDLEIKLTTAKRSKYLYNNKLLYYDFNCRGLKGFAYFVFTLLQETVLHEMYETFSIDGKRVMNPHFTGYTKL